MPNPQSRVKKLLSSRYFVLSTKDHQGVWTTPLNHVLDSSDSLSLIFYSAAGARHSIALAENSLVSGAIYVTPDNGEIDGLQFLGEAEEIESDELEAIYEWYYENNYPDPVDRAEWLIPITNFVGDGPQRFYRVVITQAWLIDVESWEIDKIDRRIEVDPTSAINGS